MTPTDQLAREILRVDRKIRRAEDTHRHEDIANLGTLRGDLLAERYRMMRDDLVRRRNANVIDASVMLKVLT